MQSRQLHLAGSRQLLLAGAFALAATACGGGDKTADTAATDTAAAPAMDSAATPAPTMGDPEILAILAASDSAEIAPSQLATTRAKSAEVKSFARMMIKDHGALEDSMKAMAQANNMAPAPNATSQQIQSQSEATLQSLQGLSGAAFDSAYVAAMVQSHQQAQTTVDSQLIPTAQNPQLKTALEQKVKPAVAMHLQNAQKIQSSLGH
jgi:putative membrane protein